MKTRDEEENNNAENDMVWQNRAPQIWHLHIITCCLAIHRNHQVCQEVVHLSTNR